MNALTSVAVRMYCTGFGDCFLLTFRYGPDGPGQEAKTLWIDFGVRAGKQIAPGGEPRETARGTAERMRAVAQHIKDYVASLHPAPDGQGPAKKLVDVLAITHEHADHISGLKQAKEVLEGMEFGQIWFAWTENPQEELAREWRRQKVQAHKTIQTALTHLKSVHQTMSKGDESLKEHMDDLKEFELAPEPEEKPKSKQDPKPAADPKPEEEAFLLHRSYQELLSHSSRPTVCYLSPGYTTGADVCQGDVIGEGLRQTPGATVFKGARIYVLGPPKDLAVIKASEPKQWEQTMQGAAPPAAHDFADSYFASSDDKEQDFWYFVGKSPFDERFVTPVNFSTGELPRHVMPLAPPKRTSYQPYTYKSEMPAPESRKVASLFAKIKETEAYHRYFGALTDDEKKEEPNQPWRRIDNDYVYEAGNLAIKLNNGVNNTSLVLAIELEDTKQVLLFSGDAEYGVWNEWERDRLAHEHQKDPNANRQYCWTFKGRAPVTVEDLLRRTILYKMGHHGSENATPKSKGMGKLSNEALHSMIPVDEATARHFCWNRIPFQSLLTTLDKRKVPYVRADKSHLEDGAGSLAHAQRYTDDSPLKELVKWDAEPDDSGRHLYVEWKLTVKKPA